MSKFAVLTFLGVDFLLLGLHDILHREMPCAQSFGPTQQRPAPSLGRVGTSEDKKAESLK